MNQISISFDKPTEEKLRNRAKENDMTVAHYVRRLVDIGLRVEEMSSQEKPTTDDSTELNDLKKLLHKDLISSYEILYLVRYILTKMPEDQTGKHDEILGKVKIKAQSFVEGLIGAEV